MKYNAEIYALEFRSRFIFEKRNETYMKYDEVSIEEEKRLLGQEQRQSFWLCQKASWCDA